MQTAHSLTRPAAANRDRTPSGWSVEEAGSLYGIRFWGEGFFEISQSGEVVARIVDGATGQDAEVSLRKLIEDLDQRGIKTPLLLRFPHILESRIELLNRSFAKAMADLSYEGIYRGVFPIKVNQQQQVIEEVAAFGRKYHYGLEAGSKPELMAALAYLDDPEALVVCNGYKDREFVDLALRGQKMGLRVILVLEMPHELEVIEERAESLGVEPMIGIRVKLSTEGGGHWASSGGEQSPFGLNIAQLIQIVDRLRSRDKLAWVHMLHCHQGSQIPDLQTIEAASLEAARIYAGLVREGAPMGYLNLGGGLAVDYDGSKSTSASSSNYSIEEYCRALVGSVKTACTEAGIASPTLVTESGRAIAAHYSMLAMKVLDVNRFECQIETETLPDGCSEPVTNLHKVARSVSPESLLECFDKAQRNRDELRELFSYGEIGLRERALAEQLYWRILTKISQHARSLPHVPEKLQSLDVLLADHYYGNFSIFQSLADSWAIGQVFPVMPLHRLDEEPTRAAVVNDVTCDCDGKIGKYIAFFDERATLPLHDIEPDDDYYLGIFMVGAYQETLSDLHNLFGDTHAISVEVRNGKVQISREVEGDSVADVLSYVEHDPKQLVDSFRKLAENAVAEGLISAAERREALEAFKAGMASYTYFES